MLAIFYIVTTPLQDTRGVPEVGTEPVSCGDRQPGKIARVSLRLVYLIFDGLLNWLTLLGRASASKTSNCSSYATKSPYSAEPTRGLAWTGPTAHCSPH
jgi:hypothetical protein